MTAVAARVPCTRPDVHLASVEPGNYDACIVMPAGGRPRCRHIAVELAPANQRFELSH